MRSNHSQKSHENGNSGPSSPYSKLQPGKVGQPYQVWVTHNSIRIGFFTADPLNFEMISFSYKKFGSVVGAEISVHRKQLLQGSIVGVSQGLPLSIQYYEYEIMDLRAACKYVISLSTNDGQKLKADGISTITLEEEKERDIHMKGFEGCLVKLQDEDAQILSYIPSLGTFHVQPLQPRQDVTTSYNMRAKSLYSTLGVDFRVYTVSQVKLGRQGASIQNSQTILAQDLTSRVHRLTRLEQYEKVLLELQPRIQSLKREIEEKQDRLQADQLRLHRKYRNWGILGGVFMLALVALCVRFAMMQLRTAGSARLEGEACKNKLVEMLRGGIRQQQQQQQQFQGAAFPPQLLPILPDHQQKQKQQPPQAHFVGDGVRPQGFHGVDLAQLEASALGGDFLGDVGQHKLDVMLGEKSMAEVLAGLQGQPQQQLQQWLQLQQQQQRQVGVDGGSGQGVGAGGQLGGLEGRQLQQVAMAVVKLLTQQQEAGEKVGNKVYQQQQPQQQQQQQQQLQQEQQWQMQEEKLQQEELVQQQNESNARQNDEL